MNHSSFPFISTVLLLVGTLAAAALTTNRPPEALLEPLEGIPAQLAGWKLAQREAIEPNVLQVLRATSYLLRDYSKNGRRLNLLVVFYAQQRAGESMHSPKNCLPGSGWEIWRYDSALIPVQGERIKVNKYSIQRLSERDLVFYWYQSKGRVIASEYLGKIMLVHDALAGHTAGSIVRLIVQDDPQASADAIEFSSALIPEMRRLFGS
jgi:EpsI family protein